MNTPILLNKLHTHLFVAIMRTPQRQNELLLYCRCILGYHEYQSVWQAALGEKLKKCVLEVGNCSDVFPVTVVKREKL